MFYEYFLAIAVFLHPLGVEGGNPPDHIYIMDRATSESDCQKTRNLWKEQYPDLHNNTMRFACIGVPIEKLKI